MTQENTQQYLHSYNQHLGLSQTNIPPSHSTNTHPSHFNFNNPAYHQFGMRPPGPDPYNQGRPAVTRKMQSNGIARDAYGLAANMTQHPSTAANMTQHPSTAANMTQHSATAANMTQHPSTAANMTRHQNSRYKETSKYDVNNLPISNDFCGPHSGLYAHTPRFPHLVNEQRRHSLWRSNPTANKVVSGNGNPMIGQQTNPCTVWQQECSGPSKVSHFNDLSLTFRYTLSLKLLNTLTGSQ